MYQPDKAIIVTGAPSGIGYTVAEDGGGATGK